MKDKPNILFVFSDQQRWCDLGCYGNAEVITPNLDRLAQSGIIMDNFYANNPVCVPSRGTLLTGTYPTRHNAMTNDIPVNNDSRSIAHVLNENGYDTAYIGKWHLGGVPRDLFITEENRLGFRYWRGCNCNHNYMRAYYDDNDNVRHFAPGYEPHIQTELALEYLDRTGSENPFALFLSFGTPHDPYELVPPETRGLYDIDNLTLRENIRYPVLRSPTMLHGEAEVRTWHQGYYAHITELDNMMGRLLQKLEEKGLRENTIIVYTSDHGNMLGSHGATDKQLPWEESTHIPFLLSYGNSLPCGHKTGIMSIVDIAPTLLALAGIDIRQESFDGSDRTAAILGTDCSGEAYLCEYIPCHQAASRGSTEWRALRRGNYKIVKYLQSGSFENGNTELYDLLCDPYERTNLREDAVHQCVLREMTEKLDEYVNTYDGYLPWEEIIYKYDNLALWNKSQKYFGLQELNTP